MNCRFVYRFVFVPAVVLLTIAGLQHAHADWSIEDPAKWYQLPDLTPAGMDIDATYPKILADDFPCNQTGPITNIHIWGSWKGEDYPNPQQASTVGFTLSIHADVPTNDPSNEVGYSYPGDVLWYTNFIPGEYTVRIAADGINEGWFDPATGEYLFPGDHVCWQYNFSIDPANAFMQEGTEESTNVYWLDVQAYPLEMGTYFGWKTSLSHWNDDAVFGGGEEPFPGPWSELRYPPTHPRYPESVDLAFVIVSGREDEEEEPEPLNGAKWIQEPDCMFGIDMPTYAIIPDQGVEPITWYRVADDWLCDGRPIDSIRWWGSYPGWLSTHPPVEHADGRPVAFILNWYTDLPVDDPDNMMGYSMPDHLITNVKVNLLPYGSTVPMPGTVVESYYCTVSNKVEGPAEEHEYMYRANLPESWNEKEGEIYWLSIEAVFDFGYEPDPESAKPQWGWKTSWETNLIDDAVVWTPHDDAMPGGMEEQWKELIWPEYPYPRLFFPPNTNYWIFTNPENPGPSMNMAFALYSDVLNRRTAKWSQMPNMIEGTDMWSWKYLDGRPGSPMLRADDFISDGRRITDIHWWGSYSNYMVDTEGSVTNPVPPPSGLDRPLGFYLSWHTNGSGNLPGIELTNLWVSITNCHEVFYGSVYQWWADPPQWEHEYQYYVDLLGVAEPWMEKTNGHYWLNIEAVFDNEYHPAQGEHAGWGWKITEQPVTEAASVEYDRLGGTWKEAGLPSDYIEGRQGEPFDLAFEITTDEITTNIPANTIVITNTCATNLLGGHTIMSVGSAGVGMQYLQHTTNLMTTSWTNLMVKPAPHPAPLTNTWHRPGPLEKIEFYRILEK